MSPEIAASVDLKIAYFGCPRAGPRVPPGEGRKCLVRSRDPVRAHHGPSSTARAAQVRAWSAPTHGARPPGEVDGASAGLHSGGVLEEVKQRARERRLGGDARAGRRVRDQVRRTQWDYVRRNWRFLGAGAAVGSLATACLAYIAPNVFLRGAVVGAGFVVVLGGLSFTVFLFTGSGPRMMGAVAETWTSSELRPLRKHGWKLVDHVFYRYADIDHLLVGPGGAIVVESKWSAKAWMLEASDPEFVRHLARVERAAHDVRLATPQLRRREGSVRAVLFLWGGGQTGGRRPAEPTNVARVDVVYGVAAAKAWRSRAATAPALFDQDEISEIWSRLRSQAAKTDEQDSAEPSPPTFARLYWTATATAVAAIVGVLGGLSATRWAGSVDGGYVYAAAAGTVGVAARRVNSLRYPAPGLALRRRLRRHPAHLAAARQLTIQRGMWKPPALAARPLSYSIMLGRRSLGILAQFERGRSERCNASKQACKLDPGVYPMCTRS